MTEYCIIFTTANDLNEALKITDALLPLRFVADVQMSDIKSAYWWQGEVKNKSEILLTIKTKTELFNQVAQIIRKNHSYKVPQIIAIPIINGTDSYLNWIKEETK
ncbi:MAG: divalent-cation tolerance protein CutA [Alphaproteobacteria bacterium]|jgi:periplasmic divalent cation tolerance protein